MELFTDEDNLGIYPLYEVFYIECILSATQSAINSLEEIKVILLDPKLLNDFGLKIIDLSENIVNQAGIISKYFLPPSKKRIHQIRGEKLRESYKIEASNLLLDKVFRNHIQHFDENLDDFLKHKLVGTIFPNFICQTSNEIDSITTVFKAFVIQELKLISLSKEIEIMPLMKEIYRIHDLCLEFIERGRLN